MKMKLGVIAASIPDYYIIVCEDTDGCLWLWNGNFHVLAEVNFEDKHRILSIYLTSDEPKKILATLLERGPDVWDQALYDCEDEADRVLPVKSTCRLLRIQPAITIM